MRIKAALACTTVVLGASITSTTVLSPAPAFAHPTGRTVNHYIRKVALPSGTAGKTNLGLWIMNPTNGRVRLCVIDGDEAESKNVLKCSAWAGGDEAVGRYRMLDVRARLPYRLRRGIKPTLSATNGVWVINYQTGQVRACLISNMDDPTQSLKCSTIQ